MVGLPFLCIAWEWLSERIASPARLPSSLNHNPIYYVERESKTGQIACIEMTFAEWNAAYCAAQNASFARRLTSMKETLRHVLYCLELQAQVQTS